MAGINALADYDKSVRLDGKAVLQLIPALDTGGAERGTVEVAAAIVRAGGRAFVASSGGRLVADLEKAGATHIQLDVGKKGLMALRKNRKAIADLVRREKIDLIHARSRVPAWVAKGASQQTGVPYMATWHGLHKGGPLKKRYNRALVDGVRVIAISDFVAKMIRDDYGVGDDRLRLIPRGADMERFDPDTVTGGRLIRLAEQWRLPEGGAPVILLPGRLTEWKGQTLLIEACAMLRDRLGEGAFTAVMVGEDQGRTDYTNKLTKMIEQRNLWPVMRLPGHCDDMAAAYKLSDIVVVPSMKPEPFGRVPLEAQAMGAMVVAAAHGGLIETVIEGETGFLFQPGDAASFADALERAITLDDAAREARAKGAAARAKDEFSVSLMTARTLSVYAELLSS